MTDECAAARRREAAFVIWLEAGEGAFRGHVEHVASAARHSFHTGSELLDLLVALRDGADGPESGGNSATPSPNRHLR